MTINIGEERPDTPDALQLLRELDAVLERMPYPQESRHAFSVEKLLHEGVVFFVTRVDEASAGCGGIKVFGEEYAEVKRMYVRPEFRGLGLGKLLLNRLESHARAKSVSHVRLETGIYQTDAIALYEKYGFQRRPPFGEYQLDPLSLYFEKRLH
jgi:putative acetyltransferase